MAKLERERESVDDARRRRLDRSRPIPFRSSLRSLRLKFHPFWAIAVYEIEIALHSWLELQTQGSNTLELYKRQQR